MSTFTDVASPVPIASRTRDAAAPATAVHDRALHRLAANLLASAPDKRPLCLLMLEVGEPDRSSLWLTTAVASIFGETQEGKVHVLAMGEGAAVQPRSPSLPSTDAQNYTVEAVSVSPPQSQPASLGAWLSYLRDARQTVLLHAVADEVLADVLPHAAAIDGVALLVRAAQTRRTELHTVERQLATAGLKCFGCVLLDHVQPIPKKLYKLL